jgi:hypothetical protein
VWVEWCEWLIEFRAQGREFVELTALESDVAQWATTLGPARVEVAAQVDVGAVQVGEGIVEGEVVLHFDLDFLKRMSEDNVIERIMLLLCVYNCLRLYL